MDVHTKDYVDAKVDAVKAQNDARFSEVLFEVRAIKPGASWQQNAGLLFAAVTFIFVILAYASDRFDGGLSADAIKDKLADEQLTRDMAQDARLDKILSKLDEMAAPPKP